jgi:hypothetical protein
MKLEGQSSANDEITVGHGQEIEFALLLSRMINTVKDDPSQMRLAIYEFARARLKSDTGWADRNERRRLSAALETAIQGVEQFSARQDLMELAPPARLSSFSGIDAGLPADPDWDCSSASAAAQLAGRTELYVPAPERTAHQARARSYMRTWSGVAIVLCVVIIGALAYVKRETLLRAPDAKLSSRPDAALAKAPDPPLVPEPPPPVSESTVATSAGSPLPPLPTDYGVYVLNNTILTELSLVPGQVPDKRIAISTPVTQPSRTMLADGKASFVLFRRDLAANAPDRMDVRVLARVARAVTFDAKGKPNTSTISDLWSIRSVSYEYRVRPLLGHPEMLLVQPANPEFLLPAGRYVLVLKNEGYEFSVPGTVVDRSQCLERTDAANGSFYSDCS